MRIILHAEEDLEFRQFDVPGLDIEPEHPELHYSALQMFATSLALCTYSMLASYGEIIGTNVEGMSMRICWSYAEKPFRIGHIDMDVHWPALPSSRVQAARLAAGHCTLHHMLEKPPAIVTEVNAG